MLTIAVLTLTMGQMAAQRVLPKMQGIAIGGGMVDGKEDSFYGSVSAETYAKGGNKWVFGAEYLQRNHKYEYGEDEKQTIPVAQFFASEAAKPSARQRAASTSKCCLMPRNRSLSMSVARPWLGMRR